VLWECNTFDEYADKIREADALSLMTSPATQRCDFARLWLYQTVLQFGAGASGTVVHGKTRSDAYFLFLQSQERANPAVFDGRVIKWPEIVVVPPARDFTFASTGMMQWISLCLPTELANTTFDFNSYPGSVGNGKTLIKPLAAELTEFTDAATAARKRMQRARPKPSVDLPAIEAALLAMLKSILANSARNGRSFDARTEQVMAKVLECLANNNRINVLALSEAAGVSERTLHRAFRKYFHMGPKRYLKIRQLNLVRSAFRRNHSARSSITEILMEHGVTEFGRFAIEYKALFRESPVETLQKSRFAN